MILFGENCVGCGGSLKTLHVTLGEGFLLDPGTYQLHPFDAFTPFVPFQFFNNEILLRVIIDYQNIDAWITVSGNRRLLQWNVLVSGNLLFGVWSGQGVDFGPTAAPVGATLPNEVFGGVTPVTMVKSRWKMVGRYCRKQIPLDGPETCETLFAGSTCLNTIDINPPSYLGSELLVPGCSCAP